MKKNLLTSLGIAACAMLCMAAQAQQYQPFRKGPTYHYIAQDSIYSLRVDSVKVVNGDSVFVFNPIARKVQQPAGQNCIPFINGYLYSIQAQNQFGNRMVKKANGDYIFKLSGNQEFLLKTKVPIGTTWTAYANSAITATLLVKTLEPVTQANPDSIITFLLSNGKTIKLSKNFGFTKTQNLASLADPYFKPKEFNFYAFPEKGIGQTISNPFAIYNFQPGDKFAYYEFSRTAPTYWDICYEEWTRLEVLTRRNSPNGDSIYYTIREERLTKGYGSPNAPTNWCHVPTATTLHPAKTISMVVTADFQPATYALWSGYYAPPAAAYFDGMAGNTLFVNSMYNQREQMRLHRLPYDNCKQAFGIRLDRSAEFGFTRGLGETYYATSLFGNTTIREMVAYNKGSETYGTWVSLGQLMATKAELNPKPLVKAFPNPFSSELTLTFGETSGKTQLSLRNTLGQVVWEKEITATSNAEMKVNLPELAKGLYVLQASQNGKIFTSRILKE